jgi:hypothetical protein
VTLERGKFLKAAKKGTSVALLDPVIAKAFPTSEAVNAALRGLLALTEEAARINGRSGRGTRTPQQRHDNSMTQYLPPCQPPGIAYMQYPRNGSGTRA